MGAGAQATDGRRPDPVEFDAMEAESLASQAEHAPPPPGAGAGGPELHDARTEPPPGSQPPPGPTPEEVEARFKQLGEEDLKWLLEVGFGLMSSTRGPHWKMPHDSEEAALIAMWSARATERLELLAFLGKWGPVVMAGGFLAWAIKKRLDLDELVTTTKGEK